MILVTGGARSGKSSFGESLLKDLEKILYVATCVPFDDEMEDRVKHHKESRPKYWDTLECYKNFDEKLYNKINNYNGIILDCITIMVTNIIIEECKNNTTEEFNLAEKKVIKEVEKLIETLKSFNGTVVLVTNEVGFGLVPENKLSRYFRDIAGRVNQLLAKECENVYLVVSSLPVKIK